MFTRCVLGSPGVSRVHQVCVSSPGVSWVHQVCVGSPGVSWVPQAGDGLPPSTRVLDGSFLDVSHLIVSKSFLKAVPSFD